MNNDFYLLWKRRAEREFGHYMLSLYHPEKEIYEYIPTTLEIAVAYAETLSTDTDFSPECIEITRRDRKRFAVAKGRPSNGSTLHSGYVIYFGVRSHHIYKDRWEVYLT